MNMVCLSLLQAYCLYLTTNFHEFGYKYRYYSLIFLIFAL